MNCITCGQPANLANRCTNWRCLKCHAQRCTPGGGAEPGHGFGGLTAEECDRLNQESRKARERDERTGRA